MSAPQPNASPRAAPQAARRSAEEPAAEETLAAHANRVLRARLTAASLSVLDPGIALLQWLRKAAGGVPAAEAGEGDAGSRKDRAGGRSEAGAAVAEAEAPAPRRRLRAFLVYVGVLLAGAWGAEPSLLISCKS